MRTSSIAIILLSACELSTEKDPEGPAEYDCTLTITGSDYNADNQVLEESYIELYCELSEDKNEIMDRNCASESSKYDDYDNVSCDWSCSVISICEE